ncbi:MAG: NHLP leader peptide family natural product precursor [Gammaproteobacteria bacterium]|nr:NHLP leader peptide family natural product precursor [Gammaproteobacteria bacterium]
MTVHQVPRELQANPALAAEAEERMNELLTRSATDANFRSLLLTEPRAAIAEFTGQEVPAEVDIHFVENQGSATFVLPDPINPDAELAEDELDAVAGGGISVLIIATLYVLTRS